jgi:hypothetical protein
MGDRCHEREVWPPARGSTVTARTSPQPAQWSTAKDLDQCQLSASVISAVCTDIDDWASWRAISRELPPCFNALLVWTPPWLCWSYPRRVKSSWRLYCVNGNRSSQTELSVQFLQRVGIPCSLVRRMSSRTSANTSRPSLRLRQTKRSRYLQLFWLYCCHKSLLPIIPQLRHSMSWGRGTRREAVQLLLCCSEHAFYRLRMTSCTNFFGMEKLGSFVKRLPR